MSKGSFVSELPCERLVRNICGPQWRNLSKPDLDAAWGIAMVKSVLDGVDPDVSELAYHLGTTTDVIGDAFYRLNINGIFRRLNRDRVELSKGDMLTWGYYGGYAAGATGNLCGNKP